jgi:hypothetical protein
MLQEIRREILLQELTTVLHDEAIPAVTRNETVGKIFSYWCRQERIEQGTGKPLCAVEEILVAEETRVSFPFQGSSIKE